MLLIIVPVMALTILFAWRYRARRTRGGRPTSPSGTIRRILELVIWSAPLLIIICLGALTWGQQPICSIPTARSGASPPAQADARRASQPLEVRGRRARLEVAVHLSRSYGIATVNDLAAPVDMPIHFSHHRFGGDELLLRARAGRPDLRHARHGDLAQRGRQPPRRPITGFSANYSGAGFLGHELPVPRDGSAPASIKLGRDGEGGRRRASACELSAASAAERKGARDALRLCPPPIFTLRSSTCASIRARPACRRPCRPTCRG